MMLHDLLRNLHHRNVHAKTNFDPFSDKTEVYFDLKSAPVPGNDECKNGSISWNFGTGPGKRIKCCLVSYKLERKITKHTSVVSLSLFPSHSLSIGKEVEATNFTDSLLQGFSLLRTPFVKLILHLLNGVHFTIIRVISIYFSFTLNGFPFCFLKCWFTVLLLECHFNVSIVALHFRWNYGLNTQIKPGCLYI